MAGNPPEKANEKAATPSPALSLLGNENLTLNMVAATAEGNGDPSNDQMPPYSVFNRAQKRMITWQTSSSAVFSGLSSFIYYPTITTLSESLHVSVAAINLTVAVYLIVAGIAPSVFGDISDQTGRRPVSLLTTTLYFAANIGLAIQDSYTALVALRCLQSAGSAATIAIAHGVISDITTPAERGYYVGILFGFTNAAPSLGHVIGGAITKYLSWRWVFWLLSILSGCQLGNLLIFFPGDIAEARWEWQHTTFTLAQQIYILSLQSSQESTPASRYAIFPCRNFKSNPSILKWRSQPIILPQHYVSERYLHLNQRRCNTLHNLFRPRHLHFHRNGRALRTEPPSVGTTLSSPRHRRAHRLSTDRQTARLPIQSRCSLLGSLHPPIDIL